jgi:hypothetical protein
MALLLREQEARTEARAVSAHELLHKLRSQDRERILDRLNSRSTAEIETDSALRRAAEARLLNPPERRAGRERRSDRDRRSGDARTRAPAERRSGRDRRSGHDRRGVQTAPKSTVLRGQSFLSGNTQ